MRKTWAVLRREFVERVRNKWFVISTVLGPVLMAVFIFLPLILAGRGGQVRTVTIVHVGANDFGERVVRTMSASGAIRASLLSVEPADLETVADSLAIAVGEKVLDGFLIVTEDAVARGSLEYRGSNTSSPTDMRALERLVREAVLVERLDRVGVDPALVAQAQIPVRLKTVTLRGGKVTEASGTSTFILSYAMWLLLYMAILLYGLQVMGSIVEEKTSRIVEVLISSLRPFQLLAGKVAGVGGVGLFQLAIWGIAASVLFRQRGTLARMVGLDFGTGEAITLPPIPATLIALFLAYFLLGYFLYAAMFAAVGAMSNSDAEARQAQTPVVMLLAVPAIMLIALLDQPDSALSITLSLIPFSAPIAMPVRWAVAEVPPAELVASLGGCILAVIAVTWIAARIYRVGILMYGKRPGLKELGRWVRTA